MTIEDKAVDCYAKNRQLKEKYHIPEVCWIDWFTAGYERAQADQPNITPLEFSCGVANTPLGDYIISFNDEECVFDVRINREWHDSFNGINDAIEYCNKYHSDLIMSCFSNNEEEDE